ncbi:MAG: FtsQ-type POTRA domain-containing protein [Anaerolineales bacterium]|nr:FtsQ-type POTRA domain-containing protein [Anaerolineales bacterium]
MLFSVRKSTHSPAARRAPRRRLNTIAQGTLRAPTWAGNLWSTQRPKIFAIFLFLAFVVVVYVFFDTDYFYVFNFDIVGARYVTAAEIEKASGVRGYNIFFIDARSVERALAKVPEVKSATVTTRLPNYVAIEIQERQPALVWQRGSETYWVDADGIFFRARAPLTQLPTVRDLDPSAIQLGQRAQTNAVAAFWALREAMPESPRALEWSAGRGIAFTDERGWKIYLGDADDMPGKVAVLRALVAQLVAQNTRIRFIDLGKGDPYYQ